MPPRKKKPEPPRKTRSLRFQNIGPIKDANVEFGDLTVLVGPQASGKSLFAQLWKLCVDGPAVAKELAKRHFVWDPTPSSFLGLYLGKGMESAWRAGSSLAELDGAPIDLGKPTGDVEGDSAESIFYVPAARASVLRQGFPRAFDDFTEGEPYCLKKFSEVLGSLLSGPGMGRGSQLRLPSTEVMPDEARALFDEHLMGGFAVRVEEVEMRRQLRLLSRYQEVSLPYTSWSNGQREAIPLAIPLGWMIARSPRLAPELYRYRGIVVEEPETGLHPRAIEAFLLLLLDLIFDGYQVLVTTHSATVLDLVWTLNILRREGADGSFLLRAFNIDSDKASDLMRELATRAMKFECRAYLMDRNEAATLDISSLDPGSDDSRMATWGGLFEFGSRVGDVVADAVNAAERRESRA